MTAAQEPKSTATSKKSKVDFCSIVRDISILPPAVVLYSDKQIKAYESSVQKRHSIF